MRIKLGKVQLPRYHLRKTTGEPTLLPQVQDNRAKEQADHPLGNRHREPIQQQIEDHNHSQSG